jgi:hypothetical protein
MYKIFVTNMNTMEVETFLYKNKNMALNRFAGICNELGYSYTPVNTFEIMLAGGIGHAFRVELIKE